jgi:hypothetical protein
LDFGTKALSVFLMSGNEPVGPVLGLAATFFQRSAYQWLAQNEVGGGSVNVGEVQTLQSLQVVQVIQSISP